MEKTYFYYMRNEHNHPAVTVCLLFDELGTAHRGLAFVNRDCDFPHKKVGRAIAEGRARKAMKRGNTEPIRSESLELHCGTADKSVLPPDLVYKSCANAMPCNQIEEKIFKTYAERA